MATIVGGVGTYHVPTIDHATRAIHRHDHVPASSTAAGLIVLENA